MKVRTSIEGPTATIPRRVKAFAKDGAFEAAAVANAKTAFGIVVDGATTTFPGGRVSELDAALEKHGQVLSDPPGPPSPYKGSWKVAFGLTDGRPVLELRRKMAAYAAVLVRWDGKGWTWEVSREERWFAKGKKSDNGIADSMERAIHTAVASLDQHVRDACVVQHMEKRVVHDDAWAATHPQRPERAPKELPTVGQPKKAKARPKDALPTSSKVPPPSRRRTPKNETVIPARTAKDREADALYGPLVVTPLHQPAEPPPTSEADSDAALMRMFAAAVDQALAGASP